MVGPIVDVLLEMAWRRLNGLLIFGCICWSTGVRAAGAEIALATAPTCCSESKVSVRDLTGRQINGLELEADRAAGKKAEQDVA
ncbi:hypothetical protein EOD23_10555 [Mesorhizobium sp. USDA-HM6]|nr:hypothetical protein EOD23_10555 [Mesorhizobium sp. USDA-HM6]